MGKPFHVHEWLAEKVGAKDNPTSTTPVVHEGRTVQVKERLRATPFEYGLAEKLKAAFGFRDRITHITLEEDQGVLIEDRKTGGTSVAIGNGTYTAGPLHEHIREDRLIDFSEKKYPKEFDASNADRTESKVSISVKITQIPTVEGVYRWVVVAEDDAVVQLIESAKGAVSDIISTRSMDQIWGDPNTTPTKEALEASVSKRQEIAKLAQQRMNTDVHVDAAKWGKKVAIEIVHLPPPEKLVEIWTKKHEAVADAAAEGVRLQAISDQLPLKETEAKASALGPTAEVERLIALGVTAEKAAELVYGVRKAAAQPNLTTSVSNAPGSTGSTVHITPDTEKKS